jgi:NodT family efflux transporter outer membrane factor (OMF) lipoprotein
VVGPDYVRPATKVQNQFSQPKKTEFTEALEATNAQRINPVAWWASFKDPTLNQLLARAASDNLSLQRAAVRVAQARSQFGVSEATLLPTAALSGSASRNNNPNAFTQYLNTSPLSNTRNLMIQANWEIDFWGKYRRGIESTLSSYISVAAAYYSADVSLASDVANTYINIRNYEGLIQVAKNNLAFQAESLRIARSRFANGSTSLLDLSQSESQYEQTKSQIPTLIASLKMAQYTMSILLGESPDYYEQNFQSSKAALVAPAALQVGIPKDLLRRRPDILQAEYAAAARACFLGITVTPHWPAAFCFPCFTGAQSLIKFGCRMPRFNKAC